MKLKNLLDKLAPYTKVEVTEIIDNEQANVVDLQLNPLGVLRLLSHYVTNIECDTGTLLVTVSKRGN